MSWRVIGEPQQVSSVRDGVRWRYVMERDDGKRRDDVFVELSGTAAASAPESFPSPLDEAVGTRGRSVLERGADRVEPPSVVWIDSEKIVVQPRLGFYEPGDRVYVRDGDEWLPATVVEWGEPADAVDVPRAGVGGGVLRRDVLWVRRAVDGTVERYRDEHVRPQPPDSAR